jgi:hypothetical protein
MRMRRLLALLSAGMLALALTSAGALAQAAPQGDHPAAKPAARGLKVTRQVKVGFLKPYGYYLKGPTEVYMISNKNPDVLEPLFKSRQTVTIEAIASGDLLTIQTIDGKKYTGKPAPAAK